jgi:starch synthase (maltosyl-transferring)
VPEKSGELPAHLRRRVAIERVSPDVDGGRFAAKRLAGDEVVVEADIVCDGHDELDCRLLYRFGDTGQWNVAPMTFLGNDRWRGSFTASRIGLWHFTVTGRVDAYATWLRDLGRRASPPTECRASPPTESRAEAGEDLTVDLAIGTALVAAAAHAAAPAAAQDIARHAARLKGPDGVAAAHDGELRELMSLYADRRDETRLEPVRPVWVDRVRAGHSAWYEVFPRSWGREPGRHGTLADLADRLEYIRDMGFDVLYLTPIHPIGMAHRKGRNNALVAGADDPGSPWAIGGTAGGHTAIHPDLGGFADFERLRSRAESLGMELALDLAIQCSPDHPWIREHPEWFRHRPDGTIQYAENPPKKYQDIVPFDFQCDDWRTLWAALGGIVRFWIDKGVRIFRVDNPHTKPFAFWEWLIADIHRTDPGVLFLSEAFTRPKPMYRLAKLGFTQSYTYFTWRTEKQELADYLVEVTTPPVAEFFRPNFWPNTPDILHETLQQGGRPMFMVRLALAALTVGNWGMYGPVMELLEATPREAGSEEYLDSEKYELRRWHLDTPDSLAPFIRRLNDIRHAEPALARLRPPAIQPIDDDCLLAWSRFDATSGSRVVVVVNLDPGTPRSGRLMLDTAALGLGDAVSGLDTAASVTALDLLSGATDAWDPTGVTIECTPEAPVRVFRLG